MTDPAPDPVGFVPGDPFARYEGRVLDQATAVRLPGEPAPSSTVYRGDTLLVTAPDRELVEQLIGVIGAAAAALDLQVAGPDPFTEIPSDGDPATGGQRPIARDVAAHNRFARLLALAGPAGVPLVVPVRLVSSIDGPAPAVDVWPLLQSLRSTVAADQVRRIGLDHLMFAAKVSSDPYSRGMSVIRGNPYSRGMSVISGNPYSRGMAAIGGNPYSRGMAAGVEQYLQGGSGGHGPVSVVLAAPRKSKNACSVHVVVLDTGVGRHPWFEVAPVGRRLTLDNGDPIGLDVDDPVVAATDPEGAGAVPNPLTGLLGTHAGHGTFIAGLLRQSCPDADITVLRVMDGDGVVAEDELTEPLMALGVRLAEHPGSIDALVLSLGYYAESGDDIAYTAGLKHLLLGLASAGVITFAAAGNDCTDRRSYPAAFADDLQFNTEGALPLLAVAALNPDRSVALFSNDAHWVNGESAGANVVSTAPVLASGAWSADTSLRGPNGQRRGTIDPDQFSSGFATWSGTSFAAPVLAGKYLAGLVGNKCPTGADARRALVPRRAENREEADSQ